MPANISAKYMERIAIIDHDEHKLFIEDLDEDELAEKYNGEEEKYIKDCYTLSDNWTWEFITDTWYYPNNDPDPIEIEFSDLV